jgi:hypothetical protein
MTSTFYVVLGSMGTLVLRGPLPPPSHPFATAHSHSQAAVRFAVLSSPEAHLSPPLNKNLFSPRVMFGSDHLTQLAQPEQVRSQTHKQGRAVFFHIEEQGQGRTAGGHEWC